MLKDLGNLAVHSHKPIRQFDALTATRELFHICFWLARTYARTAEPADGPIDFTSEPKGMTITDTAGPNQGKTFPAIYELKGDTLRICYDLSGAKRPTEFKTVAGTQLYLVTYTRVED